MPHFEPIGAIHSPFRSLEGMPIQPAGARGVEGHIALREELAPGLRDLEGFSHLILIYHFHRGEGCRLEVTPFLDHRPHGVFATRAPRRPNAIGLSIVRLEAVEGARLAIRDVDILDGTPLLDLKPYVPRFDRPEEPVRTGWLEQAAGAAGEKRSDDRFL